MFVLGESQSRNGTHIQRRDRAWTTLKEDSIAFGYCPKMNLFYPTGFDAFSRDNWIGIEQIRTSTKIGYPIFYSSNLLSKDWSKKTVKN
jgi:hypothetical protein